MAIGKAWRLGGFATALAASGALIASATGATGAYFDDAHSGTVTGTIGQVKISAGVNSDTGGGLNFSFNNMLPGELQSKTVHYQNTGTTAEDLWLVFPDASALHAVNNLGSYGEVHVSSNGTEIFASTDLDDGYQADLKTPEGYPAHCPVAGTPNDPCTPLPNAIELKSNLAQGDTGDFSFSFAYSKKLSDPAVEGHSAFCYPLIQKPADSDPTDQVCDLAGTHHYGLPYQIVATQPGVRPDDPNNSVVTP